MHTYFHYLANTVLLPPGLNLFMILFGIFLSKYWHRLGTTFMVVGFASLYLLSTSVVAMWLVKPLQTAKALDLNSVGKNNQGEKAIVVLTGGGHYAPEYQKDQPSANSMVREAYAATLHKEIALPVIVIGGTGYYGSAPEAKIMQENLAENFNIPTYWVELQSRNTWENGLYVRQFIKDNKITQFYLVTSAWHMSRAMWVFEKLGMQPTPAPTDFITSNSDVSDVYNWLPRARMLMVSNIALHEYLGKIWYRYYFYREKTRGKLT